jgi:hypothetical protein
MKCRDIATRLRRSLSIVNDVEHIKTPSNVRTMRHTQLHAERIRDHCLKVITDPASTANPDLQKCSSIVLIMHEEDAMMLITELESRDD